MKYCDVLIEDKFLFQDALTYKSSEANLEIGMRVEIKVRNRDRIGFIVDIYDPVELDFEVHEINGVVDDKAILNDELMELAHKMAYHYVAPTIACFQTILPNKLKPKSTARPIKMTRMLRFVQDAQESLTDLQSKTMAWIKKEGFVTYTEARKSYSGIRTLIDRNLLEEYEIEAMYSAQEILKEDQSVTLTEAQNKAIEAVEFNVAKTYLLHGVTGSGKTEVYLQVAKKVLNEGKQVLIMVPEISLTPQMIERVSTRFGRDVAIYHSALNDQEKYEQYKRVLDSEVKIVVGTRSSVFLPFENLGLIVVDEEHDTSYKQNRTPYYHARDIALWRHITHQCPLILGSASPALESYARALKGVYTLIELPERINQSFPIVNVVDTQKGLYKQKSPYLSEALSQGIQKRLDQKEQVILLLNRRGYLPLLKDAKTDQVLQCPHCDVALNYHKYEAVLRCHVCGYEARQNPKNTKIIGTGIGTQRLSELISNAFPKSRVLRMDADSTRKKGSHKKILDSFINHDYDILIGTQMIAKGLDVANVTLVGVINADAGLAHSDYRSVEQAFSILLQATGRSGRGGKVGEVIMQSFNPDHYAIVCAANQKYKHFFQQEMEYRKLASYPPYSYLISIVFSDEDMEKANEASALFMELFDAPGIQTIGPSEIRRLSARYRTRIILKGKDLDAMIKNTNQTIASFRLINKISFSVDVNPMSIES